MNMSARVVSAWYLGAAGTFLPLIPKVRPHLDRPLLDVQFPKRAPFSTQPTGHFNPGARWLQFPPDGPWFKKPRPARLDRESVPS